MSTKSTRVPSHADSRAGVISSPGMDEGAKEFRLATSARVPILALGGDLKASVCLQIGSMATLSRCLGNLSDPTQYRAYCEVIDGLRQNARINVGLIVHDLHPNYHSTRLGSRLGLPTIGVQHHHAHVASVMAEHRITKPVIGICCDGVGFGDDDAAWGCEVLHCHAGRYKREGHLVYFPLLGGDAAAVDAWRPALALVQQSVGNEWRSASNGCFDRVPEAELNAMSRLASSTLTKPMTSSLGRVFDGLSYLLGLCDRNTHEAEAAIALENAATHDDVEPYPYETRASLVGLRMSLSATIRAILRDIKEGHSRSVIASRFHETVARMLAATALMAAEQAGVQTIVLTGGCFANNRLRTRVVERLEQRRCHVVVPKRLPFGDAALALGQAAIAAAIHKRGA